MQCATISHRPPTSMYDCCSIEEVHFRTEDETKSTATGNCNSGRFSTPGVLFFTPPPAPALTLRRQLAPFFPKCSRPSFQPLFLFLAPSTKKAFLRTIIKMPRRREGSHFIPDNIKGVVSLPPPFSSLHAYVHVLPFSSHSSTPSLFLHPAAPPFTPDSSLMLPPFLPLCQTRSQLQAALFFQAVVCLTVCSVCNPSFQSSNPRSEFSAPLQPPD